MLANQPTLRVASFVLLVLQARLGDLWWWWCGSSRYKSCAWVSNSFSNTKVRNIRLRQMCKGKRVITSKVYGRSLRHIHARVLEEGWEGGRKAPWAL
jgi:hypothetical protein